MLEDTRALYPRKRLMASLEALLTEAALRWWYGGARVFVLACVFSLSFCHLFCRRALPHDYLTLVLGNVVVWTVRLAVAHQLLPSPFRAEQRCYHPFDSLLVARLTLRVA